MPDTSYFGATVEGAVSWLRLSAEVAGGAVIAAGIAIAFVGFLRALLLRHAVAFTDVRLTLGRFLALALEFQLGADILSTAIAPSWDQIGKLGAVAIIRTALNYFLTKELRDAGRAVTTSDAPAGVAAGLTP